MESKLTPVFLLLSCICIGTVLPYPTEVPNTPAVCRNMIPGHGATPQKSKAPFSVEASPNRINKGDAVRG